MKSDFTGDVLVLSGLAELCRDIGAEGRYDLLPIPYIESELRKSVTHLIEANKTELYVEEVSPPPYPFGVRCWVCRAPASRPLKIQMNENETVEQGAEAKRLVDRLGWGVPSFDFVWPNDDPEDDQAHTALHQSLSQFLK